MEPFGRITARVRALACGALVVAASLAACRRGAGGRRRVPRRGRCLPGRFVPAGGAAGSPRRQRPREAGAGRARRARAGAGEAGLVSLRRPGSRCRAREGDGGTDHDPHRQAGVRPPLEAHGPARSDPRGRADAGARWLPPAHADVVVHCSRAARRSPCARRRGSAPPSAADRTPQVPGSARAAIFSVWTGIDSEGEDAANKHFTDVAGLHGYHLDEIKDRRLRSGPRSPEPRDQPTIERFIELGGAGYGLVYIGSHGHGIRSSSRLTITSPPHAAKSTITTHRRRRTVSCSARECLAGSSAAAWRRTTREPPSSGSASPPRASGSTSRTTTRSSTSRPVAPPNSRRRSGPGSTSATPMCAPRAPIATCTGYGGGWTV